MTVKEIDFKLVENKAETKTFRFTDSDGSIYDMTDSTAVCKFYKDPSAPTNISATIDIGAGTVSVPFTIVHSDTLGTYEYIIEETKLSLEVIPLVKGNIDVLPYTPFSESIEAYLRSELPANLTLTPDYQNQRIMFWRRIFQSAFNIPDPHLNIESSWPILANALFAKLVVYDALMLSASGSFIQFLGGDYTETETISAGGVKRVTTGPAEVEYFDSASSAKQAFAASAGNLSMFEALREGLCGLVNFLGVKINMCKGNDIIIVPQYHQNPNWAYPTLSSVSFPEEFYVAATPEVEIIGDTLLLNNASTYIVVGSIVHDQSITITYIVTRGTALQEGVLRLLYDGSTVSIIDDFQDNGESPEVTFTAEIVDNDIVLVATLTNTGTSGIFKGIIERIMI